MSDFWDKEELIKTLTVTEKKQIQIKKVSKGSAEYVDVRTYYPDKATGAWLPGKGIALPIDYADEVALQIMEATK